MTTSKTRGLSGEFNQRRLNEAYEDKTSRSKVYSVHLCVNTTWREPNFRGEEESK